MVFEKAQWIWLKHPASDVNEYADFTAAFPARTDGKTTLRICSKSDYACFLNGRFIGFNQFPDFPTERFMTNTIFRDISSRAKISLPCSR